MFIIIIIIIIIVIIIIICLLSRSSCFNVIKAFPLIQI